jgi:hypothetical protein
MGSLNLSFIPARAFAWVCGLSLCAAAQYGFAEDSGCKPVFDAILRQLTTPYHSRGTMTLVPGKPQQSESISTGKTIYILQSGKWVISPMTPEQLRQQEQENIKDAKSLCRAMGEESVDGVSAILYSVHEDMDGTVTDGQVWIAKASGLPVRLKMESMDSRYEYSGIVAPNMR